MLVKVYFSISKAARDAMFVQTGTRPSTGQTMMVDMEIATPEQREALLAYDLDSVSGVRAEDYAANKPHDSVVFDHMPTQEELIGELVAQAPAAREYQRLQAEKRATEAQEQAKFRAEMEARQAKDREWAAKTKVEREEREAKERRDAEAARAAAEAEKARWIEAAGSAHLRRAFERGHNCQRLYVIERAAQELSGYVVDFEDAAKWSERSCPSVKALDEAERVEKLAVQSGEVDIVWLTKPAQAERDDYADYEFEHREAVVVRGYLGKYDLVKVL